MPKLIKRGPGGGPAFIEAVDTFVSLADDEAPGAEALDLLVSLARFQAEGEGWLGEGRRVGVRLKSDEAVEGLAYDLPRLALVALDFPKFRDGRAFTSAALLRERYAYAGEIRAVGDVLRDLAKDMVRCGFDAFEPADDSTPEHWAACAYRFRHVYQSAADRRPAAFRERMGEG